MAVTSGFFNSEKHDRLYDAEQVSSIFDGIILDGVFETYGTAFRVTAGPGNMQITVGEGRAWFSHTWTLNDGDYVIEVPEANVARQRIDCVCIDVNKTRAVRANTIMYVTGSPSSTTKPTLIDEEDHKQYPIAYITVPKAADKITNANIEYVVGSETDFVTGPLKSVNLINLINQHNAEFYEWFNSIKDLVGDEDYGYIANELASVKALADENAKQIDRLVKEVFDPSQGQNLGSYLTTAQKANIENGSFSGLYPGDYWEIDGTRWYIIDYDYYMKFTPNDGTPPCTKHHLVVMPIKVFKVNGVVNKKMKIDTLKDMDSDVPYMLGADPSTYPSNFIMGGFYKNYLVNEPLTTTEGFDWQHPGQDAIDFATNAWGEDNLVSVPDVFGDYSTMFTDFNWETTQGVLIPHFLDMQGLSDHAVSAAGGNNEYQLNGFSDYSCLSGISRTNFRSTSNNMMYYWKYYDHVEEEFDDNGGNPKFIYQSSPVLPEDGKDVYFYLDERSACREYLTKRFVKNGGYQVKLSDIKSTFNEDLVNSAFPNWKNNKDINYSFHLFLRDAVDLQGMCLFDPGNIMDWQHGVDSNEMPVPIPLKNFSSVIKPLLLNKGYSTWYREQEEQYKVEQIEKVRSAYNEKWNTRLKNYNDYSSNPDVVMIMSGGIYCEALFPISPYTADLENEYLFNNNIGGRIEVNGTEKYPNFTDNTNDNRNILFSGDWMLTGFFNTSDTKLVINMYDPPYSAAQATDYDGVDRSEDVYGSQIRLNPGIPAILSDFFYPIVCCIG